jgi:hypothetical protein
MAFLYISTWLFTEQLRLFHELALEGCRWWYWSLGGAGLLYRPASECRPAPPSGYFERLLGVARRIVGHASFPGKHEAVQQCLEEVGDLIATGTITADQGAVLAHLLSGTCALVS